LRKPSEPFEKISHRPRPTISILHRRPPQSTRRRPRAARPAAGRALPAPPPAACCSPRRWPRAARPDAGRSLLAPLPATSCLADRMTSVQPAASFRTSRRRGSHWAASLGFDSTAALACISRLRQKRASASSCSVLRSLYSSQIPPCAAPGVDRTCSCRERRPSSSASASSNLSCQSRRALSLSLVDSYLVNAVHGRNAMFSFRICDAY
jgi:hypothetical protein